MLVENIRSDKIGQRINLTRFFYLNYCDKILSNLREKLRKYYNSMTTLLIMRMIPSDDIVLRRLENLIALTLSRPSGTLVPDRL